MLFINGDENCIKIQCGHYIISLAKQSSWYNCLIDNSQGTLTWEECKHLTRLIYNTINRGKKLLPDQEWVVDDYIELSKILVALNTTNQCLDKNYNEEKMLERRVGL